MCRLRTQQTQLGPRIIAVMIDIRVVGPDEWLLWRRLRRAALTEAPEAFGSTLRRWSGAGDSEQRWRDRLESVALNLVLNIDGQPAGMVSATDPAPDGAVELISLWVAPHARGHGVGDAAVERVVAWVRERHPDHSIRLSVKQSNQAAQAPYERHRFTYAGPSPDDRNEVLMRR